MTDSEINSLINWHRGWLAIKYSRERPHSRAMHELGLKLALEMQQALPVPVCSEPTVLAEYPPAPEFYWQKF